MPNDTWDHVRLGAYIRKAREALPDKPSLRSFAKACSLAPGHLSQLERGGVPEPGVITLARIARGLGISPVVLLEVYNPDEDWRPEDPRLPVLETLDDVSDPDPSP